jgi:EVE domain
MVEAFIWQGNPRRWHSSREMDLDIAHESKYIYWSTPILRDQIQVGDKAYMWRAGKEPRGIIATGTVEEPPQDRLDPKSRFKHPERLYPGEEAASSDWKTGISITEFRLTPGEGMLTVGRLRSVCPDLNILRNPRGTVFRVNAEQYQKIEELWAKTRR